MYNYQINYQLTSYPSIKTLTPLIITIQKQAVFPITISPQPKSTYNLSSGGNLTLSFDISDPQNAGIQVLVDTGSAKAFTVFDIVVTISSGVIKFTFSPPTTISSLQSTIRVTVSEIFDA
jgi:hypothetical protein